MEEEVSMYSKVLPGQHEKVTDSVRSGSPRLPSRRPLRIRMYRFNISTDLASYILLAIVSPHTANRTEANAIWTGRTAAWPVGTRDARPHYALI